MKKSIAMLVLLAAIPTLVLTAQPGPMKDKHNMPGPYMGAKLQLTDAQKEQMHALKLALEKKQIPMQADLKVARLELEELLVKDAAAKQIDAQIAKVNEIRGKLFEMRIRHRMESAKILTAEQKKIMQEFRMQVGMKKGMMGRRGERRMMKRGPHGDHDQPCPMGGFRPDDDPDIDEE